MGITLPFVVFTAALAISCGNRELDPELIARFTNGLEDHDLFHLLDENATILLGVMNQPAKLREKLVQFRRNGVGAEQSLYNAIHDLVRLSQHSPGGFSSRDGDTLEAYIRRHSH